MLRGLFVTGTDTNVGKTVVAAALLHRYRRVALLRYWKPIQTGTQQDDDTATARALGECSATEIFDQGLRLPRPLSPHLAARLAGQRIELEPLTHLLAGQDAGTCWVVEGAGGVLVPLNERHVMLDLIEQFGLPVVVVARSGLGTINHTLLTLEALRHRSQRIADVVMVGDLNKDNRAAIEQFGRVPVLGELPRFPGLTPENLGRWAQAELDPDSRLQEYLHD